MVSFFDTLTHAHRKYQLFLWGITKPLTHTHNHTQHIDDNHKIFDKNLRLLLAETKQNFLFNLCVLVLDKDICKKERFHISLFKMVRKEEVRKENPFICVPQCDTLIMNVGIDRQPEEDKSKYESEM